MHGLKNVQHRRGDARSPMFAVLEAVADRYLGPTRTTARTVEFGIGVIVLKAVATGVFLLLMFME